MLSSLYFLTYEGLMPNEVFLVILKLGKDIVAIDFFVLIF